MNNELIAFLQLAGQGSLLSALSPANLVHPISEPSTSTQECAQESTSNTQSDLPYDTNKPYRVIKRPREELSNGECVVCDAPNSGFHFGVIACAACSAFFRRTVAERRVYECRRDSTGQVSCPISYKHRCSCRACRLQKCLAKGMDPSGVQPHRDSIGSSRKPMKRSGEGTGDDEVSSKKDEQRNIEQQLGNHLDRVIKTQVEQQTQSVNFTQGTDPMASALIAELSAGTMPVGQLLMAYNRVYPSAQTVSFVEQNVKSVEIPTTSGTPLEDPFMRPSHSTESHTRLSTPVSDTSSREKSDNLIARVVRSYRLADERRRMYYCPPTLRDILGGTPVVSWNRKFKDVQDKGKFRFEIILYIEMISVLEQFSMLALEDKIALVRNGVVGFVLFEKYFYTMKNGGIETNRLMAPNGAVIDLNQSGEVFYYDIDGGIMDKETCVKLFYEPLRDSIPELAGAMKSSGMTEVEFMAISLILFFDPTASHLSDPVRPIVRSARESVYQAWFQYYAENGVSSEEAALLVGNSMLTIPALKTILTRTQERFHMIRVFDIVEYDKLLDELLFNFDNN